MIFILFINKKYYYKLKIDALGYIIVILDFFIFRDNFCIQCYVNYIFKKLMLGL